MRVVKKELATILRDYSGNQLFTEALRNISGEEMLLWVLVQYVAFNGPFGGGVANLAGEVASRSGLFRDAKEPVVLFADRSSVVAAKVFAAAVDEFGDTGLPGRVTHRELAQAMVKGAACFFKIRGGKLARTTRVNKPTRDAALQVASCYGLNQTLTKREVFWAMGGHAGSELLADGEFRILNVFLREYHPRLVAHLEAGHVRIGRSSYPAYYWIRIHCSVEADHFAKALEGMSTALRFTPEKDRPEAKQWMLQGFAKMARVQRDFMQSLCAL